MPHTARLPPAL